MHVDERDAGPYRIYTGASPSGDGYTAGVAVLYVPTLDFPATEVFAEDILFDGHLFSTPQEALDQAMNVGHDVVRRLNNERCAR